MNFKLLPVLSALIFLFSCQDKPKDLALPQWEFIPPVSDSHYRGLYLSDDNTLWISGTNGFAARSLDEGLSWDAVYIPGAEGKDLRDIHAFSANDAVVLNIADSAKFFRTSDGGSTWSLVYENNRSGVFFDGMDFWADGQGFAFSDPIDNRMVLSFSPDFGKSWIDFDHPQLPQTLDGEAGFAASGTSIICLPDSVLMIGLGGLDSIRVFRSENRGKTWEAIRLPVKAGTNFGIYTMAQNYQGAIFASGGSYSEPDLMDSISVVSSDLGKNWQLIEQNPPSGYRSGMAFHPTLPIGIAVGTNGSDISMDGGKTWKPFSEHGFNAVVIGGNFAFAVGSRGKMARLDLTEMVKNLGSR